MLTKEELKFGIEQTQKDMDIALRDAGLRNEIEAVEARYAALDLIKSYFCSAAGARKLRAYRDNYHREFILSVTLDEADSSPVMTNTNELTFAGVVQR